MILLALRYIVEHAIIRPSLAFGMMAAQVGLVVFIASLIRGAGWHPAWLAARDVAAISFAVLFAVAVPFALHAIAKVNRQLGVTLDDIGRMSKEERDQYHRQKALLKKPAARAGYDHGRIR